MGVKSWAKPSVLNRGTRGRVLNRGRAPGYPGYAKFAKNNIFGICGIYGQGVIVASAGRVLI